MIGRKRKSSKGGQDKMERPEGGNCPALLPWFAQVIR
jgi:hypothetical protein